MTTQAPIEEPILYPVTVAFPEQERKLLALLCAKNIGLPEERERTSSVLRWLVIEEAKRQGISLTAHMEETA